MTSSTLHTVNKSPFQASLLANCLEVALPSQAIVLLEDGVYGILDSSPTSSQLLEFMASGGKVFALENDLKARGINIENNGIKTLDYKGFVDLCTQHNPVQSWY